jgi:hypothetical protein
MGATAGILTAASTVGEFASQRGQANALVARADYQSSMADITANDAIARGNQEASLHELAGGRAIGAQRAGQAASGIDPNSGTAADLQGDEAKFSALDAQMIRNNAAREAWGYRTDAMFGKLGAENEAANLRAASYSTLLTGATKTYGLFSHSSGALDKKNTNMFTSRGGVGGSG